MAIRTVMALGVAAFQLAGCASRTTDGLIVMEPAYAAKAALAPIEVLPPQVVPLDLAFPENGAVFSETSDAYVAGQLVVPDASGRVDAVIVIDTSHSTAKNTLAKATDPGVHAVRGPHRRGHWLASILEVELASALRLLRKISPGKTQLGVVSFAGVDPSRWPESGSRNARVEVPLTRAMEDVAAGLQQIGMRPASGHTDMAAGLNQAIDELVGHGSSRPDPRAHKVVIFFTDGQPTLPFADLEDNEKAVIRAAQRAADFGVRVFSFAVGPEALERPLATVEMARHTDGVFTPVRKPRDLSAAIDAVRFTNFDELVIRNVTLGVAANEVHVGDDGTFEALVPLVSGKNQITIRALSGNVSARTERIVHYAPGTAQPFEPTDLGARAPLTHRELEVGIADRRQRRRVEVFIRKEPEADTPAISELGERELSADVAAPPP